MERWRGVGVANPVPPSTINYGLGSWCLETISAAITIVSAPYLLAWYAKVCFVLIFFFVWSYISKPSETRASIETIYRPKCQNIESNYHSATLNCQTIWLMFKSNPMRIPAIVSYYCHGWNTLLLLSLNQCLTVLYLFGFSSSVALSAKRLAQIRSVLCKIKSINLRLK